MTDAHVLSDAGLLLEMLRRQPPGPIEDAGAPPRCSRAIPRRRVRPEVLASGTRLLVTPEQQLLDAGGVFKGHERWCLLRTDTGEPVAETTAILRPDRIPAAARAILGISRSGEPDGTPAHEPLGKALRGQGVTREPCEATLTPCRVDLLGEPQVIYSAARLWRCGNPTAHRALPELAAPITATRMNRAAPAEFLVPGLGPDRRPAPARA